jgi:hypothetical protein
MYEHCPSLLWIREKAFIIVVYDEKLKDF